MQTRTTNETLAILNDGYMLIKTGDQKAIKKSFNTIKNGFNDKLLIAVLNYHIITKDKALEILAKSFEFYKKFETEFREKNEIDWESCWDDANSICFEYKDLEYAYVYGIISSMLDDFEQKEKNKKQTSL